MGSALHQADPSMPRPPLPANPAAVEALCRALAPEAEVGRAEAYVEVGCHRTQRWVGIGHVQAVGWTRERGGPSFWPVLEWPPTPPGPLVLDEPLLLFLLCWVLGCPPAIEDGHPRGWLPWLVEQGARVDAANLAAEQLTLGLGHAEGGPSHG